MDLVRSENDAQGYVILGRDKIEQSGATNVEDLLRQQLSMSSSFSSSSNNAGGFGGASSKISLRGLPASQTLVLINGRRAAGVGSRGNSEGSDQPDLNGIPMAAIERIEVLPASASAIYGGGALGGVINVILRRDYVGTEVNLRYETTDDGEAPVRTGNLTTGFALEGGRTQVLLSAQYQKTSELRAKDRDFLQRGRARQLANNPDSLLIPSGVTENPPAGALVNVRSANGSPLFGPGSSYYTHLPAGYRGWQLDGLAPLVANQGTYSLDPAVGALNGFTGEASLIGWTEAKSAMVNVTRAFTDNLDVFFDAAHDETKQNAADTYYGVGTATLAANSPNNPFGRAVRISYPLSLRDRTSGPSRGIVKSDRAAVGFSWKLPGDWRLVGDYAWSRSSIDYSYRRQFGTPTLGQAVNAGVVDLLRDTNVFPTDADRYSNVPHTLTETWQRDTTLRAAGSLGSWYAGSWQLAAGLEHREIDSYGTVDYTTPPVPTRRNQTTNSLYAEATVPLASPALGIPGLYSADLQLAVRHERYDVEGSGAKFDATMPTFGLRYQPIESLILRASYGKGFVAPSYSQLVDPVLSTTPSSINDPRRGNEFNDQVFTLSGGNPNLEPETAKNFNAGLVFLPTALPNLRVSLDYFRIKKNNNITTLSAQQVVDNEALYPGRVIRAPLQPGDTQGVGAVQQVNTYAMNMLRMETSGIDLAASYRWNTTRYGTFGLSGSATFTHYYRQQATASSGLVDHANIPSYNGGNTPIDTRGVLALTWSGDAWSAGWASEYYGSYKLNPTSTTAIANQGSDRVSSQLYHDAFVRYRVGQQNGAWGLLGNVELTLGLKNVFDKKPPVDMSTTYYYSTFADPRQRRIYLNIKKTF